MKALRDIIDSYRDRPQALRWGLFVEVNAQICRQAEKQAALEGITRQNALFDIIYTPKLCPICGKRPLFQSLVHGYKSICCSSLCSGKLPSVKVKRAKTNIKKYGAAFTIQVKKCAAKRKRTMIKNHGVAWSGSSIDLSDKSAATRLERYGSTNPLDAPGARDKRNATMMARHGVLHIMQNREVHEAQQRAGFKIRNIQVDGKKYAVRGYEPQAIKWLHKKHEIPSKHILATAAEGVPSVAYVKDGVHHVYHPDLKVKFKGRWWLVEVKSSYTGGLCNDKRGLFSRLKAKARYCSKAGYRLMVAFVDERAGVLPVVNISNVSRKEMIDKFNTWRTEALRLRLHPA